MAVGERVPMMVDLTCQDVLACSDDEPEAFMAYFTGSKWLRCDNRQVVKVTHWQELPEPPR
jgi:hypothetical protein